MRKRDIEDEAVVTIKEYREPSWQPSATFWMSCSSESFVRSSEEKNAPDAMWTFIVIQPTNAERVASAAQPETCSLRTSSDTAPISYNTKKRSSSEFLFSQMWRIPITCGHTLCFPRRS